MFQDGDIEGVVFDKLTPYKDQRGWLIELYREDEVAREFHPVMGYMSMTHAGIARGPHEHRDQADLFCFLGPSCLLYTSPSPRDGLLSRMPSSA